MRVVCISDTHGLHEQLEVPEGDVLIFAGDATNKGSMVELASFARWFNKLPHAKKIFVPGNHDICFHEFKYSAIGQLKVEVMTLMDSFDAIPGQVTTFVYGSPVTPMWGSWPFMLPRLSSELNDVWSRIPLNTRILVTHGPPHGILDLAGPKKDHVGCELLRKKVEQVKPKLHVFGHVHGNHGVVEMNGTIFVNAAVVDNMNNLVNKPIVIDI